MPRIGTRYDRQYPRPGDEAREAEEAQRLEQLRQAARVERDTDENDLMAAAREALDERVAALGGTPLDGSAIDAAVQASTARSRAAVEASQLTQEQKLGLAVADALIERGVVPEPPSPAADIDGALDEDEHDEDEPDFYEDEAGAIWQKDGDEWTQVKASDEEELESYDALAEWEKGVDERRAASDAEDESEEEVWEDLNDAA